MARPLSARHPGEGRDPRRVARASFRTWIPAFAGMTIVGMLATQTTAQITAPTPPTPPTVAAPALTQGGQSTTQAAPTQADVAGQLQKILGNQNASQSLNQAMILGMMMNCTQQQAGKDATKAFYTQMEQVGKTMEAYCKQGNATEARALLLSTLQAKHNDPVTRSALMCYEQQRPALSGMGGTRLATDMEHYARWIRDPSLAEREVTEADVCKPKPVAQAQ